MNARPMHAGGETHLRSRSGDSLRGGRARQTLRVVIVDDHPAILEALADTLTGKMDIELVGQARTADEALRVVADEEPAVAVVDVSLKDTYGLDLVQTLRQEFPDLKVIVFSMHDETVFAERAVRAGAAGYVMKTEPTQRVVEAIRSAARGEVYLSRRMASRLLTKLVRGRKHVPRFAVDELTERVCERARSFLDRRGETHFRSRLSEAGRALESCEWSLAMAMSDLDVPVLPWLQGHQSPQLDYISAWTDHDRDFREVRCRYYCDETVYALRGLRAAWMRRLLLGVLTTLPGRGDWMEVTPFALHFGWMHEKEPLDRFAEMVWSQETTSSSASTPTAGSTSAPRRRSRAR